METITKDIDVTEEDMMREALALLVAGTRQPNEVTTKMFKAWFPDISDKQVFSRLEKLVRAGVLRKRKVIDDGHMANAYAPISGSWKDIVARLR